MRRSNRTSAAAAGLAQPDTGAEPLRTYIESQWALRRKSQRPSPCLDYPFARAVRDGGETSGASSAVHGDWGPHNPLVEDDRLVRTLDGAFAHAGDSAEGVGIARIYVEQTTDWCHFIAACRTAGRPEMLERRIHAGMRSHCLKGAALSATSTRNVGENGNRDYDKAMMSLSRLPQIKKQLVQLMLADAHG